METVEGEMDDAEGRLDALETAIADTGDFGKRVVALEGEMDTAQGDISKLKEDVNAHTSTLGTLVGTVEGDAGKSIRDIAALVISEALVGGGDDFDTLQEIAAWIKDHPADAAAMNEAIQSVKANLGYTTDEEGKEVVPATVDARIASAIAALEIGTYAKAADLEQTNDDVDALTVRVKAIEDAPYATTGNVADAKAQVIGTSGDASTKDTIYGAKKHAEEKAATAKSEAITAAANSAAGLYEEKGVAAGLVDGLANGQVKTNKEAIEALQNLTKGALTHEGTGMVSNVERDANGEITVTHRAIKHSDLDTTDVFVFYCGNATGYADDMKSVNI